MTETFDHHFLIGGDSRSNASGEKTEDSRGMADCWIIELNAAGELIGQKTFGGDKADAASSLSQNAAGEIIAGCNSLSGISGEKLDFNRGQNDFWIVKLTPESLGLNVSQPLSDFSLYPNPASDAVHLSNSKEPIIEVAICDVLGKRVLLIENVNSKSFDLDISSLNPGAYFITIKSQNQNKITKKLMVL